MVEAIVQEISEQAKKLLEVWGQENAPPPAHIYSLDNIQGGGLHVIQKTFQGNFEVLPLITHLISVRYPLQLQILTQENHTSTHNREVI
jgi:hypothetical protein